MKMQIERPKTFGWTAQDWALWATAPIAFTHHRPLRRQMLRRGTSPSLLRGTYGFEAEKGSKRLN